MMPTIFPSGPDGWTTFWTAAVSVRLLSSMTVTVIRRRLGDAIAVTIRTTDRMGSGRRCFFRPQGARRKRISVTVRIGGTPPELEARSTRAANPLVPVSQRDCDDIIVPAAPRPTRLNSVPRMRPESGHATNSDHRTRRVSSHQRATNRGGPIHGKTILYCDGNCALPQGGI